LREDAFRNIPGLLLFYDNKVICYKKGESQGYETLQLDKYNIYKTIAHSLIFYSIKHNLKYQRLSDLCLSLQDKILEEVGSDISDITSMTIEDLMNSASELFLHELHRANHGFKQNVFEGIWPLPLLIIVAGPASPRIGHPAMQYFSRLAKKDVTISEMSLHGICVHQTTQTMETTQTTETMQTTQTTQKDNSNLENTNKNTRFLYYVENPQNLVQALEIGLSLYIEESIFSKYKEMKTDILAQISHDYLNQKCKM
jgi:hypothetical protein